MTPAKRPDGVEPLTEKQAECTAYQVRGGFLHFLTYGGARSTKTFRNVRILVARAVSCAGSRHGVFRATQKSVRASIQMDTLPKVLRLCFPGLPHRINKTEGICYINTLHSEPAEIWLCGMDNAERVEKILGMEFATLFFNEISELAISSVQLIWTRLAQATSLPLLALYDCNPPKKRHWSYRMFFDKADPTTEKPLPNPHEFGAYQLNPADNPHLPEQTKEILQNLPPEKRKRFWDGEFGESVENALWSWEDFKPMPKDRAEWPDFVRVVVAVDPPGDATNPDNAEAGIVVCGLGTDGIGYVLADRSCRGATEVWAAAAVRAYDNFQADAIVGEVNFGGDMVRASVHAVDNSVAFVPVRASRRKAKRASPIAALYKRLKVRHAPRLDTLENQMCEFSDNFDVALMGYSPDRADALVWGLTHLMLNKSNTVGAMELIGT